MKLSEYLEAPFAVNGVNSWIHCFKGGGINKGSVTNYHYHEYTELIYTISGGGILYLCGKAIEFSAHSLIYIDSKEAHGMKFDPNCEYICVKFMPFILNTHEQSLYKFSYTTPFFSYSNQSSIIDTAAQGLDVEPYLREILDEWEKKEHSYEMVIKSDILRVVAGYLRCLSREDPLSENVILSDKIRCAISYILENYNSATGQTAAEHCHLSYNYFSHLFKKETGIEFKDFLLSVRIREAKKFLLLTEKDVTSIALETGFATSSHFAATFRKITGMTPLGFRKKGGINPD